MDEQALVAYCMAKKGAEETYPFGPSPRVFKVMGKMFALMPKLGDLTEGVSAGGTTDSPEDGGQALSISLKCDPIIAQMHRNTYPAVRPGYYLNKEHWNTVSIDGTIPEVEIQSMIDHSYELIVRSLTRKQRAALETL